MLHTDETAKIRAQEIIDEMGLDGVVEDWYWLRDEDKGEAEDIFFYSIRYKDGKLSYPSWDAPSFKRNGEMSDFKLPVYA
ncbi:MAG: hypothetical protein IJG85_00300 [Eubacteriaceae bacterium]|nr:hypothetical protein [Eubacteriaceae bacterium]